MFLPDIPKDTVHQANRYMGDMQDLFEQTLSKEEAIAAVLAIFLCHSRDNQGKKETFKMLIESQIAMCVAEDNNYFEQFGLTYPKNIE